LVSHGRKAPPSADTNPSYAATPDASLAPQETGTVALVVDPLAHEIDGAGGVESTVSVAAEEAALKVSP
jgi:hypothetical protein